MNMNNVCLIGRITRDIELRYTDSGIACVSTSIAVNNGKDKDGNEKQADFPKIYVYEKQAENLSKYCKKGSLIGITGKIKTRSWDKEDGTKGYETYVSANRIEFLDSKPKENNPLPEPEYSSNSQSAPEQDPFAEFGKEIEKGTPDDDLPF